MTFEEKLQLEKDKVEAILHSKKIDFIEFITNRLKDKFENLKPLERMEIVDKIFFYSDMPNKIEA
jgi:hypothetical protein|tara:strand:- start:1565 stop:1759 length:195 start_codon:yes stop_codon:yes gene_type:complete